MQHGFEGFEDAERVEQLENENESLRGEVAALKGTVEAHGMAITQLQERADAADSQEVPSKDSTSSKVDNRVTVSPSLVPVCNWIYSPNAENSNPLNN